MSVTIPLFHPRWAAADTRGPLTSPGRITVPPVASEPLPNPEEMCSGQPSPHLPRGGETPGHHRTRLDYPDPIIDLRDGADYFRTIRDKTGNVARVVPGGEQ